MERIALLIIGLLLLNINSIFGQSHPDSIQVRKSLGVIFLQHGRPLKPNDLLHITRSNPEALKEMKIAKSNYGVASVLSFTGGLLVGYPIGTALGGGEPKWAIAGIGAGLIAVSIPFSTAYVRHTKKAVNIYNKDLRKTGFRNSELNLGICGNGMGLKLTF